jgi:putative membrane protein
MGILRMHRWALAGPLVVLALAGAAAPAPSGVDVSASKLISEIHGINQTEMMMGQLAQSKGSTAQVRRYGLLLARDHRLGDDQLISLARDQRLGVAATGTSPADQAMMLQLQGLSGKAFDRQFLADMKSGHEKAIAMLKGAQGQQVNPSVRDFVGKLLPILGQHRDLSQHLQGKA